jgi:hypothetical protein
VAIERRIRHDDTSRYYSRNPRPSVGFGEKIIRASRCLECIRSQIFTTTMQTAIERRSIEVFPPGAASRRRVFDLDAASAPLDTTGAPPCGGTDPIGVSR